MPIPLLNNIINIEYHRYQLQFFHKPVYLNLVSSKERFIITFTPGFVNTDAALILMGANLGRHDITG